MDAIEENLQSELEECGVLQDTLLGLSFVVVIISEVFLVLYTCFFTSFFLKIYKHTVLKFLTGFHLPLDLFGHDLVVQRIRQQIQNLV